MEKMKIKLHIFGIIVFWVLLAGCSPAETAGDLVKINVCSSGTSAAQTVNWYAIEKGIYEQYGLEVNYIQSGSGSTAASTLIAGEADFCLVSGPAAINAVVAGEDLVMIGGLVNTYIYSLVVRPEIQSADDLVGKAVAISKPGSSSDAAIRAALRGLGLEPDDQVAVLAVGGNAARLAAMETGEIAGTVVSIPSTVEARDLGYWTLVKMSDLNTPYAHLGVVTRREFIENNRSTAINFMKAMTASIARMKSDRQGAMEVMAEYLSLDIETDAPTLAEGYDALIIPYLPEIPYPVESGVQTILDALVSEVPAAANFKAEDLVDASIVRELEESGFIDEAYGR